MQKTSAMAATLENWFRGAAQALDELIFAAPQRRPFGRFLAALWIAGLFLGGMAHWAIFLNRGDIAFSAYDWSEEYIYHSVLQKAIATHVVPYHVSFSPASATSSGPVSSSSAMKGFWLYNPAAEGWKSWVNTKTRFLGSPQVPISPQLVFLPFMSIGKFILFNTLLLYAVGFLGCWLLRRRYGLSLFTFSVLVVLLGFNGFVTSHVAVGHLMWTGMFLLPFFCLCLLQMLEGDRSTAAAIRISLVLFVLFLQGSFHIVLWSMLLLLFVVLRARAYFRQFMVILVCSGSLLLFRLLPAAMTFWGERLRFWTGYPTVPDLFAGLAILRNHRFPLVGGIFFEWVHWWEFDGYIGIVGLAFILYFGVYQRFSRDPHLQPYKYEALDLPLCMLTLLSLNYFYYVVTKLPIPLVSSERVSSRLLTVPIIVLVVISCIRLQTVISRQGPAVKLLALAGLLEMTFAIATHSYFWRLAAIQTDFASSWDNAGGAVARDLVGRLNIYTDPADHLYLLAQNVSALISFGALLFWLSFLFWGRKAGGLGSNIASAGTPG